MDVHVAFTSRSDLLRADSPPGRGDTTEQSRKPLTELGVPAVRREQFVDRTTPPALMLAALHSSVGRGVLYALGSEVMAAVTGSDDHQAVGTLISRSGLPPSTKSHPPGTRA